MCTSSQRLLGMLLCAALTGCGSDLTIPDDSSPANVQAISGNGQEGTVGSRLSDPLVIEVTNSANEPLSNVAVEFAFEGASTGAEVESASGVTDPEGRAWAEVRLGTETGPLELAARVVQAPALRTTFTVTAVEGQKEKKGRGKDKHDDDDDEDDDD